LHASGTHADSAEAIVTGGFKIGGQGVPVRHGDSNGTGQSASQPASHKIKFQTQHKNTVCATLKRNPWLMIICAVNACMQESTRPNILPRRSGLSNSTATTISSSDHCERTVERAGEERKR
jgi:hypothetical protein